MYRDVNRTEYHLVYETKRDIIRARDNRQNVIINVVRAATVTKHAITRVDITKVNLLTNTFKSKPQGCVIFFYKINFVSYIYLQRKTHITSTTIQCKKTRWCTDQSKRHSMFTMTLWITNPVRILILIILVQYYLLIYYVK